jgi:hypothetical protein
VLEQAQVHADGVVVVDLPQLAAAHQVADAPDGARIEEGVVDEEDEAAALRLRHQAEGLLGRGGQGLRGQDVFARSRALSAISKCVDTGVATATACTAGLSITSMWSAVKRTPGWRNRAAARRSGRRSLTAITCAPAASAKLRTRLGPQ